NNALVAFGLVRGERKESPSDEYPAGQVMGQSVEPGIAVETNTKVDIIISTGPEEKPEKEDKEKEVPFNVRLTLPDDGEDGSEVEIRVDRIQDGITEIVYKEKHKADGKTIKIPLK